MSLFVASLNSGSNGNCYYIGNHTEAVLVDVGISCRETEKRMQRIGLSMDKVKAIFISHEHSDHIRGLDVISRKHKLPVYITPKTLRYSGNVHGDLVRHFNAYENISVGDLTVTPFPKLHDASDPHSFIVSGNGYNVGVLTDIGSCCEHVLKNFSSCHAAFLEANYDETMLQEGNYPVYLKKRISGNNGHLSNRQALELFLNHKPEFMSHVFLSHLSKDNNSPELVHELFTKHCGNTKVVVASRYKESEVYTLGSKHSVSLSQSRSESFKEKVQSPDQTQMSLF